MTGHLLIPGQFAQSTAVNYTQNFLQTSMPMSTQVQVQKKSSWTLALRRFAVNTIEPITVLQNTLERLIQLFAADEDQLLHRLPHSELGMRLWARLRPFIEVATLVPTQSSKPTPHEIRGAAYHGVHLCRFKRFQWHYSMQIPRARSRELLLLHLFSGHRRDGDLSSFLCDMPAPSGTTLLPLALDIIFDPVRCDLSRLSTQRKWLDYAKVGAIVGFIAGPPCETWSAARAAGGRAGSHHGDGGPRQIRSWNDPFGLPALSPDERRHVDLSNQLLLFSIDMALEMLPGLSFFLLEHPDVPDDAKGRDLPTIWETGPLKILQAHPAVQLHHLLQGRFGAKSPKPTGFLEKGLSTLREQLVRNGTCAVPKALRLGKTEGVYHTSSLKEYPPRLCAAIGGAVKDFLHRLDQHGTHYVLESAERSEWVREVKANQNFSAQMGSDRAGHGR